MNAHQIRKTQKLVSFVGRLSFVPVLACMSFKVNITKCLGEFPSFFDSDSTEKEKLWVVLQLLGISFACTHA